MPLPDNRIRLPSVKIDFVNDVGIASQDHDDYPPPQGQARFDHMRMFLIGLLSQQSSLDEPSEKRDGTPWFDLNTATLKVWYNGEWRQYSEIIPITTDDGLTTLQSWHDSVSGALASLAPELFFAGACTANGISDISIPTDLQSQIYTDSRAFVYVNGQLIDPRETQFIGTPNPTIIRLTTVELETDDTFMVTIRRIPSGSFTNSNVVIP